mmetsp:Transcript_26000/g.74903  ORF Transcript_26000/g.74903 Transcript_26000/m.74903 type:complete len:202 (+) Transcript_26000:363-968(+)
MRTGCAWRARRRGKTRSACARSMSRSGGRKRSRTGSRSRELARRPKRREPAGMPSNARRMRGPARQGKNCATRKKQRCACVGATWKKQGRTCVWRLPPIWTCGRRICCAIVWITPGSGGDRAARCCAALFRNFVPTRVLGRDVVSLRAMGRWTKFWPPWASHAIGRRCFPRNACGGCAECFRLILCCFSRRIRVLTPGLPR